MDNIQLYYIDNEINKIDKMKQGDVIYKNGVELLVVLSYDHNEPCKGCFFYEDKAMWEVIQKNAVSVRGGSRHLFPHGGGRDHEGRPSGMVPVRPCLA